MGCEILSVNANLPDLIVVRSDQGPGTKVEMYPQPVFSKPVRLFATFLLGLGFASAIYLTIVLVQWLVLKTPSGQ